MGVSSLTSAVRPQPITTGRRGSFPSRRGERRWRRETWPSPRAAGRRGKPSSCRRRDARLLWTTLLLAHRRLENAPVPHILPSHFPLSYVLTFVPSALVWSSFPAKQKSCANAADLLTKTAEFSNTNTTDKLMYLVLQIQNVPVKPIP